LTAGCAAGDRDDRWSFGEEPGECDLAGVSPQAAAKPEDTLRMILHDDAAGLYKLK
jgi:hypothetical protein